MCLQAGWASSGVIPQRGGRGRVHPGVNAVAFIPGSGDIHAMNMRAAEAMVSSAPKPMKIFPISEVWSQVELS
jgi:hypothetical protein